MNVHVSAKGGGGAPDMYVEVVLDTSILLYRWSTDEVYLVHPSVRKQSGNLRKNPPGKAEAQMRWINKCFVCDVHFSRSLACKHGRDYRPYLASRWLFVGLIGLKMYRRAQHAVLPIVAVSGQALGSEASPKHSRGSSS